MSQEEPSSRDRLQQAAVELYTERGFTATPVAAVAERAGLTERTYFRHFPDKREVLFANEASLRDALVAATLAADTPTTRAAVDAGLAAVAAALEPRRDELRRRESLIAVHPELQERERMKLAGWASALEDTLRARGVPSGEAQLAAAVGIAVLDVAARRWLAGTGPRDLTAGVRAAVAELAAFTESPANTVKPRRSRPAT